MTSIEQLADESRETMPADLRRRVLVEAGHRCAIPTCRHIEVDIHHIVPWAQCRAHDYDNLIALCPNCHRRADKGEIDRKALRLYKFNLRFLHDKYSQVEMDVLFALAKLPDGEYERWPAFNRILLRRIEESGFITVREVIGGIIIGSMRVVLDQIWITPKGREYIGPLRRRPAQPCISISRICPAGGFGRTWSTVRRHWSRPRFSLEPSGPASRSDPPLAAGLV